MGSTGTAHIIIQEHRARKRSRGGGALQNRVGNIGRPGTTMNGSRKSGELQPLASPFEREALGVPETAGGASSFSVATSSAEKASSRVEKQSSKARNSDQGSDGPQLMHAPSANNRLSVVLNDFASSSDARIDPRTGKKLYWGSVYPPRFDEPHVWGLTYRQQVPPPPIPGPSHAGAMPPRCVSLPGSSRILKHLVPSPLCMASQAEKLEHFRLNLEQRGVLAPGTVGKPGMMQSQSTAFDFLGCDLAARDVPCGMSLVGCPSWDVCML